jgi:4-aminobutyrate aminotransferase
MPELLARHGAVIPNWVGISYDEPIQIVSGKGCRVTDSQGSSYLDFFAGILTNMLGYDVPEVRDAVERQIATGVVHTSTLYLIRNQIELAEKIVKLSGIPNAKGFFTNSGADANEAAAKQATANYGGGQNADWRSQGDQGGRAAGSTHPGRRTGARDTRPRRARRSERRRRIRLP